MTFTYSGPITSFGKVICENFTAQTEATSPEKAKSNIAAQFKKKYNYAIDRKIELPGRITWHGKEKK